VENTFLRDGYQAALRALIPDGPRVLSHNDVGELNILTSHEDNTKLLLIDYEFGLWNP